MLKIDEMRGAREERTEQYRVYCEGAPEPATKQIAIFSKLLAGALGFCLIACFALGHAVRATAPVALDVFRGFLAAHIALKTARLATTLLT